MSHEPGWRGAPRPQTGQLLVSEVFGPTLQGEGPSTGKTASFVRLGGCNLSCSWCDTAYTWDASHYSLKDELSLRSISDVLSEVIALETSLVILTGGEPGLQAREASVLCSALRRRSRRVEIETNGTVPLGPLLTESDLVVASPKLRNSRLPEVSRLRWPVLREISEVSSVFKFVITNPAEDIPEVEGIVARVGLPPDRVWLMPEGTDRVSVLDGLATLAPLAANRGWSLSSRLHVLAWGDKRGH